MYPLPKCNLGKWECIAIETVISNCRVAATIKWLRGCKIKCGQTENKACLTCGLPVTSSGRSKRNHDKDDDTSHIMVQKASSWYKQEADETRTGHSVWFFCRWVGYWLGLNNSCKTAILNCEFEEWSYLKTKEAESRTLKASFFLMDDRGASSRGPQKVPAQEKSIITPANGAGGQLQTKN